MEEYLSSTLYKLNTKEYLKLTVVLGNESCDLDSAVSAVVYAAFLDWQYNNIKSKMYFSNSEDPQYFKDSIFVPILNVDREDYELKTEVAFCLRDHGISDSNLLFRNEQPLQQLMSGTNNNVILVDHHVLADKDQFLAPYVSEVIDHRPVQEWTFKENTQGMIVGVGSCATLVTQKIISLCKIIAKDDAFLKTHTTCSKLLHSAIILDTVNFSKEVNKATPLDNEMILFLEKILKPDNVENFRKIVLDRLVNARKDVSRLNPAQLLRKDVKIVRDVLVPSFPILVENFLQRPGALQSVMEALTKRGCSIALLLGMDLEGGLQRDMAVYCPNDPERGSKLAKFLQDWSSPPLELSSEATSDYHYCRQLNLSASRKQYMPVVNEFLNQ